MTEELCVNCGHAKSLHPPWCTDPYIPGTCNFQYDLCSCREFKSKSDKTIPHIRRALDELLRRFPDEDVISVDWQLSRDIYSETVTQRMWPGGIDGPWVRILLGNTKEYVIWKHTGDLYEVGDDGAVPDDPIWRPS
jgi:hypothetical protein